MLYFISGAILLVVGMIFLFIRNKRNTKLNHIVDNETSVISEIIENQEELSGSYGAGKFSLYTEIKGVAMANNPIVSEFSKQECVYYMSTVVREYEVLESSTSTEGKVSSKWVRKSEVVSSNENKAHDFVIRDNTGELLLNTEGSELFVKKTFSKFEEGDQTNSGLNLSIGSFTISSGSNVKTIGYKFEEFALPLKTPLFVIGDANDRSGRLQLSKPTDKRPFIISTKSEDEIISELHSSANWMLYAAIGSWIVGIGLLILGIVKSK